MSGGRCEVCKGAGVKTIEMNFLPDVYVHCEACDGKRYNKETLEVRYKGKSIGDVLNLTINQAVEFFENLPHLQSKLKMLQDVGLGYIKIGQPCTTLSGGESQRIKLATELSKKDTGSTLYILDEPTTGLHFEDINILLGDAIPNIFIIYRKRYPPRREEDPKGIIIQIRKGRYSSQREGFPLNFCYLEIHRGIQG